LSTHLGGAILAPPMRVGSKLWDKFLEAWVPTISSSPIFWNSVFYCIAVLWPIVAGRLLSYSHLLRPDSSLLSPLLSRFLVFLF